MTISQTVKDIIHESGKSQKQIIEKMNELYPTLNMDKDKLSSIVNDKRKMTGPELIAFCMALEINPDRFMD